MQIIYISHQHIQRLKGGELYVVYLQDCVVDDELVNAIGIFKSENKDTFLKVYPKEGSFEVDYEKGINVSKLDKGALIFNTEKEAGFKICIVDNINKGKEAQYWKDDFLSVSLRNDDFYQTKNYMSLCEQFVTKGDLDSSFGEKDKIDLLLKSATYFKENAQFDQEDFKSEVLPNDSLLDSFNEFKETFESKNDIELGIGFTINDKVVKDKVKRLTKSLLLDKNFKLQVFGNSDLLERGYDQEKEMNFYKIYFLSEK
ncbi:MAG: hypothetical protein ACJAUD_002377 [Crocinitomicaceae bacterium]